MGRLPSLLRLAGGTPLGSGCWGCGVRGGRLQSPGCGWDYGYWGCGTWMPGYPAQDKQEQDGKYLYSVFCGHVFCFAVLRGPRCCCGAGFRFHRASAAAPFPSAKLEISAVFSPVPNFPPSPITCIAPGAPGTLPVRTRLVPRCAVSSLRGGDVLDPVSRLGLFCIVPSRHCPCRRILPVTLPDALPVRTRTIPCARGRFVRTALSFPLSRAHRRPFHARDRLRAHGTHRPFAVDLRTGRGGRDEAFVLPPLPPRPCVAMFAAYTTAPFSALNGLTGGSRTERGLFSVPRVPASSSHAGQVSFCTECGNTTYVLSTNSPLKIMPGEHNVFTA